MQKDLTISDFRIFTLIVQHLRYICLHYLLTYLLHTLHKTGDVQALHYSNL